MSSIYIVGSSKSGIGKSLVTMALINYLSQIGQDCFLVETDPTCTDVHKSYQHIPFLVLNLASKLGQIALIDLCDEHRDKVIIVNATAESITGIEKYSQDLIANLIDLNRNLITLWIVDRLKSSLKPLERYVRIMNGTISKPRDRLVSIALRLFRQHGFHATGIDLILAVSGVSKTTMYRYFRSKDELILASLRQQDEEFRNWLMREVAHCDNPTERLLVIYDVYEQWSQTPVFFGCMFINASAEFSDPDSPIHAFCIEHKRLVNKYIRDLAEAADVVDSEHLAADWMLLLDGAVTATQIDKNGLSFQQAKAVAKIVLESLIV